jgi:hypothetical protein
MGANQDWNECDASGFLAYNSSCTIKCADNFQPEVGANMIVNCTQPEGSITLADDLCARMRPIIGCRTRRPWPGPTMGVIIDGTGHRAWPNHCYSFLNSYC